MPNTRMRRDEERLIPQSTRAGSFKRLLGARVNEPSLRFVGRMTPLGLKASSNALQRLCSIAAQLLMQGISDVLGEVHQKDAPSRRIFPGVRSKGHMLTAFGGPDARELDGLRVSLRDRRYEKCARGLGKHGSSWVVGGRLTDRA